VTLEAEAAGGSSSAGIRDDHAVDLVGANTLESESVLRSADWKTMSQGVGVKMTQEDGLCVTTLVAQHMLSIDSQCIYIYIYIYILYPP
jgi:hypothetical protein